MSNDAEMVERVARAIYDSEENASEWEGTFNGTRTVYRRKARAALSAMPQRVSPELIAQLNKLASRLTAQGEYEACDLIDTVVARVSGAALEHQQKEDAK